MNHRKRIINIFDELEVRYAVTNHGEICVNPGKDGFGYDYLIFGFNEKNHFEKVTISRDSAQPNQKERVKDILSCAGVKFQEFSHDKEYAKMTNIWPTLLMVRSSNHSMEIYFDDNDRFTNVHF